MTCLTDKQIREYAVLELNRRLDQGAADEIALTRATQIIDGFLELPALMSAKITPELRALLDRHFDFVAIEANRGRAFASAPGIKRAVGKPRKKK